MTAEPRVLGEAPAGVFTPGLRLTVARAWEDGEIVLACHDCDVVFVPGPLRRYGDQACLACASTSTGFVNEEVM